MQPLVRGRGRGRGHATLGSLSDYINFSSSSTPTITDMNSPLDERRTTIHSTESESGFSSASDILDYPSPPKSKICCGRGRGRTTSKILQENIVPDDPHWTVTNLTQAQFYSTERPKKPDELGTLGQQIRVIANYFPILQFPQRGLVYKYQIQIRNRKHLEIHRDRRR